MLAKGWESRNEDVNGTCAELEELADDLADAEADVEAELDADLLTESTRIAD